MPLLLVGPIMLLYLGWSFLANYAQVQKFCNFSKQCTSVQVLVKTHPQNVYKSKAHSFVSLYETSNQFCACTGLHIEHIWNGTVWVKMTSFADTAYRRRRKVSSITIWECWHSSACSCNMVPIISLQSSTGCLPSIGTNKRGAVYWNRVTMITSN